jgi:hypothetical protein
MIIQCMSDKSEPQPSESKQSNHRVFETCGLLIVHADCYLKNPAFIGSDQGPHSFSGILLWHGSAKLMRHQVIPQQGGPGSRSTMTCMLLSSTGRQIVYTWQRRPRLDRKRWQHVLLEDRLVLDRKYTIDFRHRPRTRHVDPSVQASQGSPRPSEPVSIVLGNKRCPNGPCPGIRHFPIV